MSKASLIREAVARAETLGIMLSEARSFRAALVVDLNSALQILQLRKEERDVAREQLTEARSEVLITRGEALRAAARICRAADLNGIAQKIEELIG